MDDKPPDQLWREVGADIARALSALDRSLAEDELSEEQQEKVAASRGRPVH